MKKTILWSSCALLFLLTAACSKQNETVSLLSTHTWVVASGSLGGTIGDEYKFYDNRIFMQSQSGTKIADGKWDFDYYSSSANIVYITTNSAASYYDIESLTNTELKLTPIDNSGWGFTYPTITLTPKS